MKLPGPLRGRVLAVSTVGLALTGFTGVAFATTLGAPSPPRIKSLGSPLSAALTQPLRTDLPANQPLIVVAFANGKAKILGGSAVPPSEVSFSGRAAGVAISSAQCLINFTTVKTRNSNHKSVTARWYGGIGCSQRMELIGQAFLAESAKKFDGYGNHYSGVLGSVSSGQRATVINAPDPSLYIWHATNVYFPTKTSRGVISVLPKPGQKINAASKCSLVNNGTYGAGVHCDLYTNRF
jgi:hypothetical protein